jgi:hypothetical protein
MHCVLILPKRDGGLPPAHQLRQWGFSVSSAVRAEGPAPALAPAGPGPGSPEPDRVAAGQNDHACLDQKLSDD